MHTGHRARNNIREFQDDQIELIIAAFMPQAIDKREASLDNAISPKSIVEASIWRFGAYARK